MQQPITKSLKYFAMITDFNVERVAIAVDVAFVEGISGTKLPRAALVNALNDGVEGVVLGSKGLGVGAPTLAVGTLNEVGQVVGQLAVHTKVPRFDAVVKECHVTILIINR